MTTLTGTAALQVGRIRLVNDRSSVLVRLLDDQRKGQLDRSCHEVPPELLRVPTYVAADAALRAELGKKIQSKTYAKVVPSNMDAEAYVAELNMSIARVAGVGGGPEDQSSGYGPSTYA